MELYSTDYVLFWVDSGEFEFEKHNYPFVYATCSVEENLEDGMENNRDVLETWVPTTELPKDKQSLLIKMISEVERGYDTDSTEGRGAYRDGEPAYEQTSEVK
jgi:hypothetical protein